MGRYYIEGLTDNYINQPYGSSWLYKSNLPVTKKIYFEVQPLSGVSYTGGNIGVSNFLGNPRYNVWYNSIVTSFDPNQCGAMWKIDSSSEPKLYGGESRVWQNQIIGIGYIFTPLNTTCNTYLNGELLGSETVDMVFDLSNTYIYLGNGWNHNNITAQLYFDNDVTYKDIANLYKLDNTGYLHNGDLYGITNSTFGTILSNFNFATDVDKESALLSIDDTPTIAQLKTIEPFKIINYSEDNEEKSADIIAIPYPQTIIPSTLIDITAYTHIDSMTLTTTKSGNGNIKIAFTKDLNDYYIYDLTTGRFILMDINNIATDGNDVSVLSNISEAKWHEFTENEDGIALAYYLEIQDTTDKASVDELTIKADGIGNWQHAIYNTDFTYTYASNTTLLVNIITSGDYKINYPN